MVIKHFLLILKTKENGINYLSNYVKYKNKWVETELRKSRRIAVNRDEKNFSQQQARTF